MPILEQTIDLDRYNYPRDIAGWALRAIRVRAKSSVWYHAACESCSWRFDRHGSLSYLALGHDIGGVTILGCADRNAGDVLSWMGLAEVFAKPHFGR